MRSELKQRSGKGRKFWGNPIIKIIDMDNRNLRFLHKQSLSETYLGESQIGKMDGVTLKILLIRTTTILCCTDQLIRELQVLAPPKFPPELSYGSADQGGSLRRFVPFSARVAEWL